MFIKSKRILFFVFFFINHFAFSQFMEDEDKKDTIKYVPDSEPLNYMIGVSPQHLIFGGLHVTFEKKIKSKPNVWIGITPQFYSLNNPLDNNYEEYPNSLLGTGVEFTYRYYFGKHVNYRKTKNSFRTSFILAANYQYLIFNLENEANVWNENSNNDLITLQKEDVNLNLHRGTLSFLLSLQENFGPYFIAEAYIGVGVRISDLMPDKRISGSVKQYGISEDMYDYAFTGNILLGGLKLYIAP